MKVWNPSYFDVLVGLQSSGRFLPLWLRSWCLQGLERCVTLDGILTLLPHEAFWNVVNDEFPSSVRWQSCPVFWGWIKVWPPIGPLVGWADTDKPALVLWGRGKVGCLPGGRVSGWGLDPRPWTAGWMATMTELAF